MSRPVLRFAMPAWLFLCSCAVQPLVADVDLNRASLRLDDSLYLDQPALEPEVAEVAALTTFGAKGSWWWSIGAGAGFGESPLNSEYNASFSLHTFLVDDLEVVMEFGAWFFDQEIDDAIAGAFNVMLRWHFINRDRYSIFAEAGAGLMLSSNDVPVGGTEFNFTPRIGVGMTWRYSEGPSRLIFGARWQHFSNGRLFGTSDNPGLETAMFFGGVMIPF